MDSETITMQNLQNKKREHQGSKVIVALAFLKEALPWLNFLYTVVKIVAFLRGIHLP